MIVVRSSSLGNTLGNILPWCIAGRQALRTVMSPHSPDDALILATRAAIQI